MFIGDKREPNKYFNRRLNYDIVIDREKFTIQKMMNRLGFYTIIPLGKVKEGEIVYDTDKKLLTGSGLILRKKIDTDRIYFSLVRVSTMANIENREKKSFLGECEANDQPSDFPVQIAEAINKIFNNLFTIDLVEIVKHCTPYTKMDIIGNKYKIVSGTGYEAVMQFEELRVKDFRTGRKAKKRNFSIKLPLDPNYERERQRILEVIDKYCKELVYVNRNRFEIGEVAVRIPTPPETEGDNSKQEGKKKSKKGLKKNLAENGEVV